MYLGRVIGSVVATKKNESLVGEKLLIVQQINSNKKDVTRQEVVIDRLGAGKKSLVLYVHGKSARMAMNNTVVDASIVGIVDSFDK